jgi:hypothetical protein
MIRGYAPFVGIVFMFAKQLCRAGHTRTFSIKDMGTSGWEVRDEQDDRVLKAIHYTDWHRVERAMNMFNLQIDELESSGWISSTR